MHTHRPAVRTSRSVAQPAPVCRAWNEVTHKPWHEIWMCLNWLVWRTSCPVAQPAPVCRARYEATHKPWHEIWMCLNWLVGRTSCSVVQPAPVCRVWYEAVNEASTAPPPMPTDERIRQLKAEVNKNCVFPHVASCPLTNCIRRMSRGGGAVCVYVWWNMCVYVW